MHHRSLGKLVIRCRDSLVDRTTESIACCLSSVDAMLMEALELIIQGSVGCWRTTLLDAVSSISCESIDSDWRHCGMHFPPIATWGLSYSCLACMGSIVNSIRVAYKTNISGGGLQHTSSCFTSLKEDGDYVSSGIVALEDGGSHEHRCILPSASSSSVHPTSSQREELFRLLLMSSLFQCIHSDIHYSLAMSSINAKRSITVSDFFMIHFCARRIAILLTCLIAHRFSAPVRTYRWLVSILHCRIASNRTQ